MPGLERRMSASSSFPNRLTGVTVVLPGDLLRGVTDPEVGWRGEGGAEDEKPFCTTEGERATVCLREEAGLKSAQEGRGLQSA